MLNNSRNFFLFLLTTSVILPKWILTGIYFDNSILINTIFNIGDIQYFPLIINFSDFILNPSYIESINENKILPFPTYGILIHSLFYKIFNIYSFLILEIIFQFIFLVIFFKSIEKIFIDTSHSLYFCALIFLLISFLEIGLFYENNRYLNFFYNNLNQNLGLRLPRPLFTGIIYFYFFFILYSFQEKIKKFDLKFFLLISFLLSVFLNSFFYYFINFSIFLIFLSIKYQKKNIFKILKNNKLKLLTVLLSFVFLSLPFILQIIYGEQDYSERIGVIQLNLKQKLFLLNYYFSNLLRFESLILIISSLILHYYLNKKFYYIRKEIEKINIFFYFIIVSIISPPIFFLISPKIVSIYHFLDILSFIIIFYLILSFSFICFQKITVIGKFENKNFLKYTLIFILFFNNIFVAQKITKIHQTKLVELNKIQNFFKENNFVNSNKKLFSDDLIVMNLWLLNGNKQLIISDGFTNSLKNKDIELNFVNNLKNFGISTLEFEDILSFGQSEIRNDLIMRLFTYRYQANSLFTYSKISKYTANFSDKILKTSPFRAQSQIMPEDEKKRIIKLFNKIELDKQLLSDLVVINRINTLKNLKIYNKDYKLVFSGKMYDIYTKP
tara:strand:- start:1531 stop:3369 length:1839 start_codon:yes stop_codon:yes gene_type:complete